MHSQRRSIIGAVLWLVPLALVGVLGYVVFSAFSGERRREPVAPVAIPGDFPRTIIEDSGAKVVIPAKPVRIIPGDAGMADILSVLVAPRCMAALPVWVDEYGGATEFYLKNKDIVRFQKYVAEPLLSLKPDLLLTDSFQEAGTTGILKEHGVPVLKFERMRTFEGIRASIMAIGAATGEDAKAEALVAAFDKRLKAVEDATAKSSRPRTLCYSNFGDGYAVGTGESQDEIIRRAGGVNAAAEMNLVGHVRFKIEQMLKLNPDWIVVAGDKGMESEQVKNLLNQPALAELPAIKLRHIAVVPDRFFSSISQYVVDAVEIVAKQIHPDAPIKP